MDGLDRPRRGFPKRPLGAVALCAALAACGGGSDAPDAQSTATQDRANRSSASQAAAPLAASPAGRLLASNCFQCHGTNGKGPGFDRLAGKSASDIYHELIEFRDGKQGPGIMARHALGYSDAQLREIAAYFATQR